MSTSNAWIKANYDFGLPMACFSVSCREAMCYGIHRSITLAQENPEELERSLLEILLHYRPMLAGAAIVSLSLEGFKWNFLVNHRDLQRLKPGEQPRTYRLATCLVCKLALEDEPTTQRFGQLVEDHENNSATGVEFCSEACQATFNQMPAALALGLARAYQFKPKNLAQLQDETDPLPGGMKRLCPDAICEKPTLGPISPENASKWADSEAPVFKIEDLPLPIIHSGWAGQQAKLEQSLREDTPTIIEHEEKT